MDLKEIGIITRNLVDLAQDMNYWRELVNAASILLVSQAMEVSYKFGFCSFRYYNHNFKEVCRSIYVIKEVDDLEVEKNGI